MLLFFKRDYFEGQDHYTRFANEYEENSLYNNGASADMETNWFRYTFNGILDRK
jgi:hypothetical protein